MKIINFFLVLFFNHGRWNQNFLEFPEAKWDFSFSYGLKIKLNKIRGSNHLTQSQPSKRIHASTYGRSKLSIPSAFPHDATLNLKLKLKLNVVPTQSLRCGPGGADRTKTPRRRRRMTAIFLTCASMRGPSTGIVYGGLKCQVATATTNPIRFFFWNLLIHPPPCSFSRPDALLTSWHHTSFLAGTLSLKEENEVPLARASLISILWFCGWLRWFCLLGASDPAVSLRIWAYLRWSLLSPKRYLGSQVVPLRSQNFVHGFHFWWANNDL